MVEQMSSPDAGYPGSHWKSADRSMHKVFGVLNRYWWVPILRSGLGPFFDTPLSYVMLVQTVGRKSGKVRHVPLNYAIKDGCVYCLAGFGPEAHWYRNILANPRVEVILPSGAFAGIAETVVDESERQSVLRPILVNAGFAGFFVELNPRTASEEQLREKCADLPIVRIRPTGIGSGPADPGGLGWITAQIVVNVLAFLAIRAAWRTVRRFFRRDRA